MVGLEDGVDKSIFRQAMYMRGTTLFPHTGAVMLGVSGGSEGSFRGVDALLMEGMEEMDAPPW